MFRFQERILLKGIPGIEMLVVGLELEINKELIETDLDYGEELWSGVFYSDSIDISNGYYFDDDLNKWMLIKNSSCNSSSEWCFDSLEELLEIEAIWSKLNYAMEEDSLIRQSVVVTTDKSNFADKYANFIRNYNKPFRIVRCNQSHYILELDSTNKTIPVFCSYLHFNENDFELIKIWENN